MIVKLKEKIKKDLKKVGLTDAQVKHSNKTPRIFLCGGQISQDSKSSRYKLTQHLKEKNKSLYPKIITADNFGDWYQDGGYKELLTLEKDIAGISSAIVIILESEGSIAELGSFVMEKKFIKKLFVIIEQKYIGRDKKSFINQGILEYLKKTSKSKQSISAISADRVEKMESYIKNILNAQNKKKTEVFEKELHSAFVIYEMIRAYRALTFTEIQLCLKEIKLLFEKENKKRIENLLFILEEFKWIKQQQKGTDIFYYVSKENQQISKIQLKYFDVNCLQADIINFYNENEKEGDRLELIKEKFKSG